MCQQEVWKFSCGHTLPIKAYDSLCEQPDRPRCVVHVPMEREHLCHECYSKSIADISSCIRGASEFFESRLYEFVALKRETHDVFYTKYEAVVAARTMMCKYIAELDKIMGPLNYWFQDLNDETLFLEHVSRTRFGRI